MLEKVVGMKRIGVFSLNNSYDIPECQRALPDYQQSGQHTTLKIFSFIHPFSLRTASPFSGCWQHCREKEITL